MSDDEIEGGDEPCIVEAHGDMTPLEILMLRELLPHIKPVRFDPEHDEQERQEYGLAHMAICNTVRRICEQSFPEIEHE